MKFGKFIQGQQTEWAGPQYLNYKGLKKIINSVEALAETVAKEQSDITILPEFQAFKTAFFFKLERELEKVNEFYLQKESEFRVRLRSLVDKKKVLKGRKSSQNMAALVNLQEAFASFQQDLAKLQKFVEVNGEGFRKILKKWDKRAKSTTKELYLSRQVEIQPCFNNDVLTEFTDSATTNIAEIEAYIEHGDFPAESLVPAANSSKISGVTSPVFGQISESMNDLESELVNLMTGHQSQSHALDQIRDFIEKRKAALQADDQEFFSRVYLRVLPTASIDSISLLISEKVVDCNYVDDINNRTCVHEAAISGRLDVLKVSVEVGGGNIEILDVYGRKPLHYAAMYGKSDCLAYIVSQPICDIDLLDLDGFTALTYSIIGGFTDCVHQCLEKGAAVDPVTTMTSSSLSIACEHGHTEIATLLLSKGASLVLNNDGLSPLHLAARAGHADLLSLLIKHGGDVDLVDVFQGWTPVFYAATEGHIRCVELLIGAGCSKTIKDETDWNAWTYALYHGHIEVAKLLEIVTSDALAGKSASGVMKIVEDIQPMAPSALFTGKMDTSINVIEDLDLEELPSLSLPPPIIPFRIYGHNYLDNKYLVQVNLGSFSSDTTFNSPIKLFGSRQLSSLKLIISNKPDSEIPYNVILPLTDDSEPFTFIVSDLADVSLQFDIYPTFGTKILGRAAVLASQLMNCMNKVGAGSAENELMIVPLFDSYLRVVGELRFSFSVVNPFIHPRLQIGGKVETYWKSTMVVNTGPNKAHAESGIQSLITASSLVQEYINAVVQLTRDGIPVIFPSWFQKVMDENGSTINVSISSLTYKEALKIFKTAKAVAIKESSMVEMQTDSGYVTNSDLAGSIYDSFLTLEEVLKNTPSSVGLSIELKYPTQSERENLFISRLPSINTFLDAVLKKVYDHSGSRSIIFSSFNPQICVTMNWKQPNFGVFFKTNCGFETSPASGSCSTWKESDRRCGSIKEAIRFAKRSHFLGVMCEATPLIQVPALITTIKQSGLMLASFGSKNQDSRNVAVQENGGVDAIMGGHVLKYSVNASI
ncbi:phosphate system positive regulatory protein pho81 [Chytriomyces hyalinus]|nr:phosphate system positive regulatory protein pho81 [Chytriomyces hyalinus]